MSKRTKSVGRVLFLILFAGLIGGFGWMFVQYQSVQVELALLQSENTVPVQEDMSQEEIDSLMSAVGAHILLPEGEGVDPMIATVLDAESLAAEQVFYKDAINGDQLLLFADRVILYSPERDLIINVEPVYLKEPVEAEMEVEEVD